MEGVEGNASKNKVQEPSARHSLELILTGCKDGKAIQMIVCGQHIALTKSCTHFAAKEQSLSRSIAQHARQECAK